MSPLISVSNIKKQFDGVFALRGVTFSANPGECLALVGENGAGKSTLMKILSGVWPFGSYSGSLNLEGRELELNSPLEGRKAGISIIHQELCLFPQLSVAENLFLTEEYPYTGRPSQNLFSAVRWRALNFRAKALFSELGFDVPVETRIELLSVAQRQLVEIARALHHHARLLILDEPTSALSSSEIKSLFQIICRMRNQGMAFIYISHKLDEVFEIADRIIVLRDGVSVAELLPKETNKAEVIRHMVGRPVSHLGKRIESSEDKRPNILEVSHLSHTTPSGSAFLKEITFTLRQGEILGVAGLMGSGRSELLRSLLGVLPGSRQGVILYDGKVANWKGVKGAMEHGVAFVPEDRKRDGLFMDLPISFNASIGILERISHPNSGWIHSSQEQTEVERFCKAMRVKFSDLNAPVKTLSGGNQQKVLLAKVVAQSPRILFLDEPTRGIDVGAKEEIYEIIRKLADCGIAIVLVSSELPEILTLSDRVLVLREGCAVGELDNIDLTQERVMSFAAGENHAVQ